MRNVQKTEIREERKVVRDFQTDPMEGFPSDSLFPSRSNEINNFFRTPSPSAGFPSMTDNFDSFNSSTHQNHIDEHHHSTVTTFNGHGNGIQNPNPSPSSSHNLSHNQDPIRSQNFSNNLSNGFSNLSHNLDQNRSHFSNNLSQHLDQNRSQTFSNNLSQHLDQNRSQAFSNNLSNGFSNNLLSQNQSTEPGKYVEIIPLGGNIGPEDLTVTLKDHVLTIEAKKETKHDYGTGISRSYQEFTKKFTLPPGVDMRQVKSMLTPDGNLKIEAPLPQKALPAPPQRRERDIAIRIQ